MNTHKKLQLVVGSLLAILAGNSFADLIVSDGFESGTTRPTGWLTNVVGVATYITNGIAGDTVHSGERAILLANPTRSYDRWYVATSDMMPATGGTEYTLTAWVKTENITSELVYISVDWVTNATTGARSGVLKSTAITQDQDWTLVTATGIAPDNTVALRPVFYIDYNGVSSSSAVVTFDDYQITTTAIPEPATVGLFTAAALATLIIRRAARS